MALLAEDVEPAGVAGMEKNRPCAERFSASYSGKAVSSNGIFFLNNFIFQLFSLHFQRRLHTSAVLHLVSVADPVEICQ